MPLQSVTTALSDTFSVEVSPPVSEPLPLLMSAVTDGQVVPAKVQLSGSTVNPFAVNVAVGP